MEGLKLIPYIALVIAISGIIIGAASISLAQFGDTVDTCWNSSWVEASDGTHCINDTSIVHASKGQGNLNFSDAYYAIYESTVGQSTIAGQLPTVAIIGVMVIIISIIAGVFVYLRFFR